MINLKNIQENSDAHIREAMLDAIRKIAYARAEVAGIDPKETVKILHTKRIPFRKASEDKNTLWYLRGKSAPEYKEAIDSATNELAEAIYEHLANKGFTEKIENAEHRIRSLKSHLYSIDLNNEDEPSVHEAAFVSHIETQLQTV